MRSVLFLRPPGKKKSSFEEERDIKSINGFIKRDGLNLGHQFVLNIFKKYVSLCKCCCYYLWVLFPLLLKTNVYIFFVVCFLRQLPVQSTACPERIFQKHPLFSIVDLQFFFPSLTAVSLHLLGNHFFHIFSGICWKS